MKLATILTTLMLIASGLFACQVPVFRYALERWAADDFELLVTSHGKLDAAFAEQLRSLEESLTKDPAPINLTLKIVDLDSLTEAEKISLPALEHFGEAPTMVLLPPESWKTPEPVWTGPATIGNLNLLLDSPTRQRVANHLVKGESAVWLLVEGEDAEENARARATLEAGLARARSLLEIPTGVIRREDLNPDIANIDLDDVLRSDVPLKISFVTETVSRSDPAEAIFLPTLVEPDALQSKEPLVVPIFGRGRTPGALPASRMTVDHIFGACEYLCGACSCQVKNGNPGYDLLFKTTWDSYLNSEVLTAESEIVQQALDVVTFGGDPEPKNPAGDSSKAHGPGLVRNVVLLGGVLALALGAIFFLVFRASPDAS